MNRNFPELTALAAEWQAQQSLPTEQDDRLWKKLRLEWNYHSNHIEGNTLTYGETELLLLHDRTTGNHTHREYLEMKAHNVGIEHVRALAADTSRPITEADIRDLNRIILKEPFWKPASTADGQATRKEIIPGQYKTTPNSVLTVTGEMYYYASVEDTPPRMQALVSWLQTELTTASVHPVTLAARLHYDFVRIHPFDDGNGRVARLLANYVLMRTGYLPVIVRTEDKKNYLTALQLADAGDIVPLIEYFAKLTEWSLRLGLKAAKGEPIDEPSDVEKEIALFVREQQAGERTVPRSPSRVKSIILETVKPFFARLDEKLRTLTPLFQEVFLGNENVEPGERTSKAHQPSMDEFPEYIEHQYRFYGYNRAPQAFDLAGSVEFIFAPETVQIVLNRNLVESFAYDRPFRSIDAERLAGLILSKIFDEIKQQVAKP